MITDKKGEDHCGHPFLVQFSGKALFSPLRADYRNMFNQMFNKNSKVQFREYLVLVREPSK
jgi:hypothetical protein